ncbi:MAG: acetate--CoA ligase family protein [Actinomycetota bacterium]
MNVSSRLAPMLEATSVAVVGASPKQNSFGEQMMVQLLEGGYRGDVYPVNPRYDEMFGRRCHHSLAELPGAVDLVILGLPNALLERELEGAASIGARSAVIFANCLEEPATRAPSLIERLTRIADDRGIAVCGGNCMGFLNLRRELRACGFLMPEDMPAGGITFISHSGSAFSAMAFNDRALRFNLVVSAGQEFNTSAAHYLDYALEQTETDVVGLFLETIREPELFRAALARAEARDVPIVALKVGRAGRTKELIAAHSGALAGDDGAYEALFRAHGVMRVRSLDEMADVLELCASKRRASAGGLAAIHDSGGERALLVDAAADAGVPLARISAETEGRLAAVLEEGLPPVNPLDAWGTGNDFERIYETCMQALLDDEDTAALAFSVDLTTQEVPETGYIRVAKSMFARTRKPFALLSNLSSAIDKRDAASLRAAGIPVLEGTYGGLAAFGHLLAYRDARSRPPVRDAPLVDGEVRARWRARLQEAQPLMEVEGLELLGDYGIPTTPSVAAASLEETLAAAERIGYPVALKTAARGVHHKSDVGGVILGIAGADELGAAWRDLTSRLGPETVVAEMAPPGVELALGILTDAQFGPLVMVAAGGVLVEVLQDRRLGLPPLDRHRARELLEALSVRRLLDGVRGGPPADVDAVEDAVVRLSAIARDLGDVVTALDVNPLRVGPHGCVAVDALVLGRPPHIQGNQETEYGSAPWLRIGR